MKDNSEKWWAIAIGAMFVALFGGMAISESARHEAEGKVELACIEQRGSWNKWSDTCEFKK